MSDFTIAAPAAWLGPGGLVRDVVVTCRAGTILEVTAGVPDPPEDARAIEGFLMPAAADRHAHIELVDQVALVRRGVTAVRDPAWPADRTFPLAEASEAPGFDGPLIRAAGPMLTAPGGFPTTAPWAVPGTGWEVEDAAQAVAAVEDLAARGSAGIGVSLDEEDGPTPSDAVLEAICEAAAAQGLPVAAHAQGPGQVARALGAGVGELVHTPWSERLSPDLLAAAGARMRWVSTLGIHEGPDLDVALENLRGFARAGGEVVYGAGLGHGPAPGIHAAELQLLHDAGLGADQVLHALVRAPIEPGAPADLLVLEDDPLGNPPAFEDLRLVVKAGEVVAGPRG